MTEKGVTNITTKIGGLNKVPGFTAHSAKDKAAVLKLKGGGGAGGKAAAKVKATPLKVGMKRAASPAPSPPPMKVMKAAGGSLAGKTICFTGTISTPRAQVTAAAKAVGTNVIGAVSRSMDILIAGPGAGSKLAKAVSMGKSVWNEAEFKKAAGI